MTTIIGVYIIITVTSGLILHVIGLGNIIDESLSQNVPIYKGFMFDRNEFWSHPEQGLIFGRVVEVNEDIVKIIDGNNNG
ncbi:MAG: hypothetical protein HGB35_08415 [Geobacteraceae bacterium]|nr:hypothetical protein [Geobacteraceae bacterium]